MITEFKDGVIKWTYRSINGKVQLSRDMEILDNYKNHTHPLYVLQ